MQQRAEEPAQKRSINLDGTDGAKRCRTDVGSAESAPAASTADQLDETQAYGSAAAAAAGTAAAAAGAPTQAKALEVDELDRYLNELSDMKVDEHNESILHSALRDLKEKVDSAVVVKPKADDDSADNLFERAAKTGFFDLRDAVGLRFQRAHKKGSKDHDRYANLCSRAEKQQFREAWAKNTFASMLVGKESSRERNIAEATRGRMLTFGAVVRELGGWEWSPAVRGAVNLVAKCTLLGGRWHEVDEFSGLNLYRKLDKEDSDLFQKSWKEFTRNFTQKDADDAPDVTEGDEGQLASAVPTAAAKEPKGKGKKGKGKSKGKGNTKVDKHKDPDPASPDVGNLKKANQLKQQVIKVMGNARGLIERIQADNGKFEWANNPQNLGRMKAKLHELEAAMSETHKEFLILEPRAMVEKLGAKFHAEMICFLQLGNIVAALSKETKRILTMTAKYDD